MVFSSALGGGVIFLTFVIKLCNPKPVTQEAEDDLKFFGIWYLVFGIWYYLVFGKLCCHAINMPYQIYNHSFIFNSD